MIYFDFAATTPMCPEAIHAYTEAATKLYGNTASLHDAGGEAMLYVEAVRQQIAEKLRVEKEGIYFTGSGTEGNWLAIVSIALAQPKRHIITSEAEHTSLHAAMNYLEQHGFVITRLPLTDEGVVCCRMLEEAITEETALFSFQHINSEIGAVQPIEDIAKLAKVHNVLLHVDCVQSFCKRALPCAVDSITISAHKIAGPRGCGAIYINPSCRTVPIFSGMTHERGLRGGTLDVPAILAFSAAIAAYTYDQSNYEKLRAQLRLSLHPQYHAWIEAPSHQQLPSIIGMCIHGIEGQLVMLRCNEKGIAISTGSACDIHSASGTKAILAMGKTMDEARQFIRISYGPTTTLAQIDALAHTLNALIHERHPVQ